MKHILNQSRRWVGIALLVIAITAAIDFIRPNAVAAPEFLNYQGTLTDNAGQPLPNGPANLEFKIYSSAQPDGSEPVWGPFPVEVQVVQGRFNVVLGPSDAAAEPRPLKEAFQGDGERFIEVSVDGGAPILPRQQFLSVPYALNSGWAIGSIQSSLLTEELFQAELGADWVLADGRSASGSRWEELTTQPNVPNLRGRFVRMAGGRGGAIGAFQSNETAPNGLDISALSNSVSSTSDGGHRHHVPGWTAVGAGAKSAANSDHVGNRGIPTDLDPDHNHSVNISHDHGLTGDAETRPDNVSVNYFIKIN